ncbi:MAG: hypothetical protein ACRDRV_22125 [Pseudonocardiaceae bacterium]
MVSGGPTWVEETRRAVDQASNVEQARSEFDALTAVHEELDNALADLAELGQAAAVGRGSWWVGIDIPPELGTELSSAPDRLDRRQLAALVRQLSRLRTQARQSAQAAWNDHVAAQAGDADELRHLVQVLAGAGGLGEAARGLDEALGRLARLHKQLPDAHAVVVLSRVVELLDELERRLPIAVKAFVSAAAHGGASLELLDAEVRDWLVRNGALYNFRIMPGRPPRPARG